MSLQLSTTELTWMRAQVATLLPGTAVFYQRTYASDGEGGWSGGSAVVSGGTVACRLDPITMQMLSAIEARREILTVRFQLTVPYNAPIAADLIVHIDSRDYEILQLDADHHWNVVRRAMVAEVR
jgi:hypothetical protein